MLILVGLPVLFTEMVVGQYVGLSATKAFKRMSRAFRGLGYGMVVMIMLGNFYLVIFQTYATFYLFAGMKKVRIFG